MPSGALITTVKRSALITRVELNPEIGTDNKSFKDDSILDRAIETAISLCKLPRYPELSQGYTRGRTGASTDLSGLSTNDLRISVNGSNWVTLTPTLANMATGSAAATELQATIQAESSDGFDEVTVSWSSSDTQYTITSGRYGESSAVNVDFSEAGKHIAQALNLTSDYGAIEARGMADSPAFDGLVVSLCEILYRKLGVEGAQSASLPGGPSVTYKELGKLERAIVIDHRRLWH